MKNYGKDYKKTENGYEYVGAWYETALSAEELKKAAGQFGAKLLASCILLAGGLSVNNIGSHTFWVLIPYASIILSMIYGWMGCAAMYETAQRKKTESGKRSKAEAQPVVVPAGDEHASHLHRAEYEKAFRRPLRCGIAAAVLAWISFAADIVIVIAYKEQAVWPVEAFFAADTLALCILGIWVAVNAWKLHRSVHRTVLAEEP